MSTHSIGIGKVNISTTFEESEARLLGRVAFASGMSRNEWVRKAVHDSLARAKTSTRIAARTAVKSLPAAILLLGLVIALGGSCDMRRTASTVRVSGRRMEELA